MLNDDGQEVTLEFPAKNEMCPECMGVAQGQICPCCKGKNVINVPDVGCMTTEEKKLFREYRQYQKRLAKIYPSNNLFFY